MGETHDSKLNANLLGLRLMSTELIMNTSEHLNLKCVQSKSHNRMERHNMCSILTEIMNCINSQNPAFEQFHHLFIPSALWKTGFINEWKCIQFRGNATRGRQNRRAAVSRSHQSQPERCCDTLDQFGWMRWRVFHHCWLDVCLSVCLSAVLSCREVTPCVLGTCALTGSLSLQL